MSAKYRRVTDNVHGLVRMTDLECRIAEHPVFNRLHYVYQNSSAYLTWPSMRNRRFEHSLGTMKLAGDMFFESVSNTDEETLQSFYGAYSKAMLLLNKQAGRREIDVWDDDSKRLKDHARVLLGDPSTRKISGLDVDRTNDELCNSAGYCSFLVPSNVPSEWRLVHNVLAQAVRVVGMLHDLGHPPFSHVCEAALKQLYVYACKIEGESSRSYVEAINAYCKDRPISEVDIHEAVGNSLVGLTIEDACKTVRESDDIPLKAIYFLVLLTVQAILDDKDEFRNLHALVSGTIDADRLDYVQRDSISAGFGTDALQYARLIFGVSECAL